MSLPFLKRLKNLFKGDPVIWSVFFFLAAISLIEVYSAGSTLTYKTGTYWAPLLRQFQYIGIGFILMIVVHHIPCRLFKILGLGMMLAAFILLILTKFIGIEANGAQRWIAIGGIQFQPSEFAKCGLIFWIAVILGNSKIGDDDTATYRIILWPSLAIIGLIAMDNMSTSIMLLMFMIIMMFLGCINFRKHWRSILGLTALGVIFVSYVFLAPPSVVSKTPLLNRGLTFKSRIVNKFEHKNSKVPPKDYDLDKNAQVAHANIAIASSNFVGKMPGNSTERDFLSQAYSDFIYSIIIEETGMWGAFIVVFLYTVLLYRAGRIASRCERGFPAYLALGIAILIYIQALVNMLVAVSAIPVTGQPLPLISRGGTSTLFTCFYFGLLLSVSRTKHKSKNPQDPLHLHTAATNPGLVPAAVGLDDECEDGE